MSLLLKPLFCGPIIIRRKKKTKRKKKGARDSQRGSSGSKAGGDHSQTSSSTGSASDASSAATDSKSGALPPVLEVRVEVSEGRCSQGSGMPMSRCVC